jgi:hypothetical protein
MINVAIFPADPPLTLSICRGSLFNTYDRLEHIPPRSLTTLVNREQSIVYHENLSNIHKRWPGCAQSTIRIIESRRWYVLFWKPISLMGICGLVRSTAQWHSSSMVTGCVLLCRRRAYKPTCPWERVPHQWPQARVSLHPTTQHVLPGTLHFYPYASGPWV